MLLSVETLHVAGRASPLSQAQIREVEQELQQHHPEIDFFVENVLTKGDKDLKTSLRTLDKTDFFTKELDEMLLSGKCRIAIHSAKDLPDPIPEGLAIVAITRGADPADSLVLREGATLNPGMLIATSSERREEAVRQLEPNVRFCDIRGTIGERLRRLEMGDADGVVVAEAALIRLGLTHLNRVRLPGETAPMQGRLAIVARSDDREMHDLFSCIDTRTRCLYLGLDLPDPPHDSRYIHYPVIAVVPRPCPPIDMSSFTHIIFTSKSAVRIFFAHYIPAPGTKLIAVGTKTARSISSECDVLVAQNETAEGIIELLETLDLSKAHIFWPHSALSRPVIENYLKDKKISYLARAIYDTVTFQPSKPPAWNTFDAVYFTSPSTVTAFHQIFQKIPKDKQVRTIGNITKEAVELLWSLQ